MKSIHSTSTSNHYLKRAILLILLLTFQVSHACSCFNGSTLCSLIDHGEDFIFVKARVLEFINHANEIHSVLLEIENNFISDVDLTDTIELIGGIEAGCAKSLRSLTPGETKYITLTQPDLNIIDLNTIPEASENYWRHSPFLCGIILFEETESQIVGPIREDISRYPKDLFDQNVEDCQFKISDIDSISCPTVKLYPNPVIDNRIYFEDIGSNIINTITIYSVDGRLLFQHEEKLEELELRIPDFNENLIIIEYYCGTKKHIEKLFVN